MQPKRIIFIRHGESIGNIQASIDPQNPVLDKANHEYELSPEGRMQAERVKLWFQENVDLHGYIDYFFTSTFVRPQETLKIIFPYTKPIIDSRLDEHWRGIFHSMNKADVERLYPLEAEIQERMGRYQYRSPGGQNCPDVEARIYSFLTDMQLKYADKTVLICGHGNWQVLFRRIIENKTITEWEDMQKNEFPPNASISTWVFDPDRGRFVHQLLNQVPR